MKRITNTIKNVWGISEVGFSFMTTVETSFFLLFLTDVAGLPLAMAAIISTITGIADTVSALLAGAVIDKMHLKHGKYRSWLLYGPPFVMMFFAFEFTKIGSDLTAAIIISAGFLISHFIWNISWTANRSLVSELTDDPTEKAHLSGRIAAGSNIGKLIASKAIPIMSLGFAALFAQGGAVWGYTLTALIGSGLMLIGYYIHYFITKGYDVMPEVIANSEEAIKKEKVSFVDMMKGVFANPPLVAAVFFDFIRLIGYYTMLAFGAYFCKVNCPDNVAATIGNLLLFANLGALIGSLLSRHAVAKFGTKMSSLFGTVGCIALLVIGYFVSSNSVVMIGIVFLALLCFGVAYGLTTSLYINSSTYSEFKTGKNTQGFIMAFCSFSIKMAIVIRGLIITMGLGIIGYVAADVTAKNISAQVISGANIMFFIVPAAVMAISLIPLMFYKLSDKEVVEMSVAIAERKKSVQK